MFTKVELSFVLPLVLRDIILYHFYLLFFILLHYYRPKRYRLKSVSQTVDKLPISKF